MQTTELTIQHHGRRIQGTFYRPEGLTQFPIVIFSHGFNGQQQDFVTTGEYFARQGVGAVCYNFCGGGLRDESGFPTTQMTLLTEKEDLLAVVAQVKTWDCFKEGHLYLFGASQGGMVSALTAEEIAHDINGLVLLYPAFCIPDDWRRQFSSPDSISEEFNLWGVSLGRCYFEVARELYIEKELGHFDKPVLILHGDQDDVVSLDYSKWAVTQYPKARLEIFHEEGHGFSPEGDRRMEAMTLFFVHSCESQQVKI